MKNKLIGFILAVNAAGFAAAGAHVYHSTHEPIEEVHNGHGNPKHGTLMDRVAREQKMRVTK